MADIRKFTGFIAIDNSTHTTMKAAMEHTRTVKIKDELKKFAETYDHTADAIPEGFDVSGFLYKNREAIQAAFNQEAVIRAPRKAREPKVTPSEQQTFAA